MFHFLPFFLRIRPAALVVGWVILFLLISFTLSAAATVVRVLDSETGEPIANVSVTIFGGEFSGLSDANGNVDLSNFPSAATLVFQHAGYVKREFSLSRMTSGDFVVRLTPRIYITDAYTVTGTRFQTARKDLPQAVTDISPKTIAFQNPQTSADLLGASGQVFVQKSQLGGGSPMLRGFAANSVLLVVDGVRMNNAIFRSGNLQNVIQIDPNSLDRTEVLFGPGSVQFGSDALGGTMLFSTLDPTPPLTDRKSVSGGALARTATANFEKTSHAHLELGRGRLAYSTSLTYSDFDDLRAGAVRKDDYPDFGKRPEYAARENGEDVAVRNDNQNVQTPSGYSQFNLLQKFAWQASSRVKFGYGLYWTTSSNIPRYDRLIEYRSGTLRDAEWYYGPQEWLMNSLSANITGAKWYDHAAVILARQDQQESRHDRRFGRTTLTSRTEDVETYSLNADFNKKLTPEQKFHYGIEAVHNRVESTAEAKDIETGEISPASTRYPDGGSRLTSLAAYLGHQWKLLPAVSLTSGLRYSQAILHSSFEDTTFYSFPFNEIDLNAGALTFSAGTVWQPDTGFRIYAAASSGFRAPNVDDVGKIFDSEPGNVVVPNADLGPEYSYNVEAGVEKRFGEWLTVGGSGYYTWIEDVMVRRDFTFNGRDSILYDGTLSRVQAIVNAGHGYVSGFDVSACVNMTSELGLRTTLTYTAGRDLEEDVPLRHIPPLFGETRLTYERLKWIAECYARYNLDKPYDDLAPEEQAKTHLYTEDGTPGWYTLNLRGGWRIHRSLELQAALENILDHHYRPFSSGISAPGRNLVVALRTNF
ncbi:TonB-dependent receptor [bacterium]|nr:TonB-dependent receptor [bacterium]MBU1985413.1 TonB-dependent receptor [bacterium]